MDRSRRGSSSDSADQHRYAISQALKQPWDLGTVDTELDSSPRKALGRVQVGQTVGGGEVAQVLPDGADVAVDPPQWSWRTRQERLHCWLDAPVPDSWSTAAPLVVEALATPMSKSLPTPANM